MLGLFGVSTRKIRLKACPTSPYELRIVPVKGGQDGAGGFMSLFESLALSMDSTVWDEALTFSTSSQS